MEAVLSEFVAKTGADVGLAKDILEGQKWDLDKALKSFGYLNESTAPSFFPSDGHFVECNGCIKPSKIKQHELTSSEVRSGSSPDNKTSRMAPRPILHKANAINIEDDLISKKLSRGFSKATDNVGIVNQARNEVQQVFEEKSDKSTAFFVETPVYTFTLPDLTIHPDDFRTFLEKDLIETSTLVSLENAGRLNWWAEVGPCQKLWPLATSGDGNCLLHAASLGMWGFHDRLLTLRKALHATLTKGPFRDAFWRRWRWQQTLQNKQAEFVYSEGEWEKEWKNILRLSSTEPRHCPGRKLGIADGSSAATAAGMLDVVQEEDSEHNVYESLEEIHVLALAYVLRRPIIVVADTMLKAVTGEPLAPIPFGGIYLPLEISPCQCHNSPLVLTYDAAHFSALVAMESQSENPNVQSAVIPLVDPDLKLLTIQFGVDPGADFNWGLDEFNNSITKRLLLTEKDKLGLLANYLDITSIGIYNHPKHSCASSNSSNEGRHSFESDDGHLNELKGKTAKQLNCVAKQFGSLGRSVSKKIKKNLGNLTRTVARSGSFKSRNVVDVSHNGGINEIYETGKTGHYHVNDLTIVAALLHTNKRHVYQEEMIRNYLSSAKERYLTEKQRKNAPPSERQQRRLSSGLGMQNGPIHCINPGCELYGTVATSYLCSSCFQKQKQKENEMKESRTNSPTATKFTSSQEVAPNSLTLVGSSSPNINKQTANSHSALDVVSSAGRSKFYTRLEPGKSLVNAVDQVDPGQPSSEDPTVYLSNSVFFNDCKTDFPSSVEPPPNESDVMYTPDNVARIYVVGKSVGDSANQPCRADECTFFGSSATDYYCSKCYKQRHTSALQQQ